MKTWQVCIPIHLFVVVVVGVVVEVYWKFHVQNTSQQLKNRPLSLLIDGRILHVVEIFLEATAVGFRNFW